MRFLGTPAKFINFIGRDSRRPRKTNGGLKRIFYFKLDTQEMLYEGKALHCIVGLQRLCVVSMPYDGSPVVAGDRPKHHRARLTLRRISAIKYNMYRHDTIGMLCSGRLVLEISAERMSSGTGNLDRSAYLSVCLPTPARTALCDTLT